MKFLVVLFALVAVATCRPGGAHHGGGEPQLIRVQVQQQESHSHAQAGPPQQAPQLIRVQLQQEQSHAQAAPPPPPPPQVSFKLL